MPPELGNRQAMRAPSAIVSVAVLLLAVMTGCSGDSQPPEVESPRHPNIVFVVVDDLDATATPYWQAMPKTRKLIADRGTTFTNAVATNPVCCPARATLLTGMYPHNTEVFDSVTGLDNFAARGSKKTIGVRLSRAGYRTAFMGKYLNGYELDPSYVPPGWDEWFGLAGSKFLSGYSYQANHNGTMERFGKEPADYQTDVLARTATRFIEKAENDDARPFLLTLFPSAPHHPIGPAPRHADNAFADDPLPKRPNFNEADVSDKPYWLRSDYRRLTPQAIDASTKRYRNGLGSLLAVDEMVASVAARLKADDELDDTLFVFTSDNGYSFGSHRLPSKLVPYEESVRVPLAIAGPGVRHGTNDRPVGHIDMAPTLYDVAGLTEPDDVDGVSVGPFLRGDRPRWREDILIEFNGTYSKNVQLHTLADSRRYFDGSPKAQALVPDFRAVRSSRWLYVQWYGGDDHEYELYDMKADKYQMSNLLARPESAARLARTTGALQARMDALTRCAGRTCQQ